jgi:YHS domain-containing protein
VTRLNPLSPAKAIAVIAMAVVLSGCGAINAQNPNSPLAPVNAVALDTDARALLRGADVVAYFTENAYRQGSPEFKSQYQGVDFRFASAANKALFDQSPERYLPQYGGYCANGIVYGIPWGGDADTWAMVDGKLYIFGGQASRDAFMLRQKDNIALADRYWREEVQGGNSFVQRAKRLVFKVPHYKTGEELAAEVASSRAR